MGEIKMNNERKDLLAKLHAEYYDVTYRAEKLHVIINQAQLSGSSAEKLLRETLPQEHYNYLYDMKEQLNAMQKYAECLSNRIGYLNDEIQREEKENQDGKQD